MSVGTTTHYTILDIHGRYFVETAKAAGLGSTIIRRVLDEVRADAADAAERTRAQMPADFPDSVHASIAAAMTARLPRLDSADAAL